MNSSISKVHDRFFKRAMLDLRVARDFFEMHLPQDLQNLIRWESLQPQPNAHINSAGNESITDLVFSVLIDERDALLHLIVDHQSTPDILMPFRVENYRFNVLDAYVKGHPGAQTLPLVIPIVLYHGVTPWRYDMNINSLVDAPKEIVDAYAFKSCIFIDLNRVEDKILRQNIRAGVMQLALKHIFARDIIPHVKAMMDIFRRLEREDEPELVETVLKYIMDRGEMDQNTFLELVKTQLSPDMEGKIMTVSEQLIASGVQQGMQQGMQQGLQQGVMQGIERGSHLTKLEMAREMLREGMSLEKVGKITKLGREELERIQESV